jgi:hypothetical protein
MVALAAIGLAGCGPSSDSASTPPASPRPVSTTIPASSPQSTAAAAPTTVSAAVFSQIPTGAFVYYTGAGGVSTTLMISPDGSFSGTYADSDLGDATPDYPNGTVNKRDFSGEFQVIAQVSPDEYTLRASAVTDEGTVGDTQIDDETRYVQVDFTFDDSQNYSLYLPGRATSGLPEPCLESLQDESSDDTVPAQLTSRVLYSSGDQTAYVLGDPQPGDGSSI